MSQRRRAQNRASQRAFRERKEKHVKGIEHQLKYVHEKHQDLLQSYNRKIDEVSKLNTRIEVLKWELDSLRRNQSTAMSNEFDAFSFYDIGYFDQNALGMESELAVNCFEEL